MKRYWKLLIALVLTAMLCAGAALADDTTRIDCNPLPLNGEWTDGVMRPREFHYYPFTVDQVGKVTIRVQAFYDNAEFELLDADLIRINNAFLYGSQGAPGTYDFVYYLEPGQYYLRNNGSSTTSGDYRMKLTNEPCACDEIEPNEDYHTAQALSSDVLVSGVLTEWDEFDYYTFSLTQETQVRMVVNSEAEGEQDITYYDGDLVKLDVYYSPRGYSEELLLPAGTYYVVMHGATGPYTLKAVYADAPAAAADAAALN